jgi:hypothetical protein
LITKLYFEKKICQKTFYYCLLEIFGPRKKKSLEQCGLDTHFGRLEHTIPINKNQTKIGSDNFYMFNHKNEK